MKYYAPCILLSPAVLSVSGADTQLSTCPDWFYSIGKRWQGRYPDLPGVQIFVSSPKLKLQCKASFLSHATNYTSEPALLPDSPYRIASSTKPFTSLAVLKLVEEGHFDIQAPIQRYLPEWAKSSLISQQGAHNASQITVWMLLHHMSGLADHGREQPYQDLFIQNPKLRLTHQDVLEWAAAHLAPVNFPGAEFYYSDTGYLYLGLVVSKLTGLTLAAAVRKFAELENLGMNSTYWEVFEDPPPGALPRAGQYMGEIDWTHVDASFDLYGGGGLVSNAEDLARFARTFHQGKLLSKQTMKLVYDTVPAPPWDASYGCGWLHTTIAGEETWHHPGFWGTWMYYFPRTDLVVTGTLNQNHRARIIDKIAGEIVKKVLDTTEYAINEL